MSNQIFTNMQNIWHSRLQYRFSLFLSRLSESCRSCRQPSQEAKRGWETAWFVDSWCSQIGERKTKNFWSEKQYNGERWWWKSKKITNVGASFKVGMLFWFSVTYFLKSLVSSFIKTAARRLSNNFFSPPVLNYEPSDGQSFKDSSEGMGRVSLAQDDTGLVRKVY